MKKQKVMSQMKGQDKTPEEQLNEVEYIQRSRKRLQNNDSEDDSGSWEKNGGTVELVGASRDSTGCSCLENPMDGGAW